MKFIRFKLFFLCTFVFITLSGCSDHSTLPSSPGLDQEAVTNGGEGSAHNNLGLFYIVIDTENQDIEISPVRSGMLHLNATSILNSTMGVSAQGVPSEHDPQNGIFTFDITLTHPFPDKPQLSGFDVKGILMVPGGLAAGDVVLPASGETTILNADGYTRWWNPIEFTQPGLFGYSQGNFAVGPKINLTATVNPYKLFADFLGPTDSVSDLTFEPLDTDNARAVFRAGSENTRRYTIQFEMQGGPQIIYGYAIDCSWTPPDVNPPVEIPDDFPIAANQPEPYWIKLAPRVNTLYHDSGSGSSGGNLIMRMNYYDWQGKESGNFLDETSSVEFYCPDISPDPVSADFLWEDEFMAKFEGVFAQTSPEDAGTVPVYCRVVSSDGSTYKQTAADAPDVSLESWHRIDVEVIDPDCSSDDNNSMSEAVILEIDTPETGQLCGGTDDADFFRLDIPYGSYLEGEIRFYSDIPGTLVTVLDKNGTVITFGYPNGLYSPLFTDNIVTSGTYYFSVETSVQNTPGLYAIVPDFQIKEIVITTAVEVTPEDLSLDPTWLYASPDYLYMANEYFVWVYDVTDKTDPAFVKRIEISNTGTPAMFNDYMYLVDYDGVQSTLKFIDFTDPAAPYVTDSIWTVDTEYTAIEMTYDHIFLTTLNNGQQILNLLDYQSNPYLPEFVGGTYIQPSEIIAMDILFKGMINERVIIGYRDGLYSYSTYDHASITQLDGLNYVPGIEIEGMSVLGPETYIIRRNTVTNAYTMPIYTFNPDDTFKFEGVLNYPNTATSIVAYSSIVLICGYQNSNMYMNCYDVSDPTNVVLLDTFMTRSRVTFMDNYIWDLYFIQRYYKPRYAELAPDTVPSFGWENPQVVNYPDQGFAYDDRMLLMGNHGSCSQRNVIDISDPENVSVISQYGSPAGNERLTYTDKIYAWARNDDRLYVGNPQNGNWSYAWTATLGEYITGIGLSDTRMYVFLGTGPTVRSYDISGFPSDFPTFITEAPVADVAVKNLVYGPMMYGGHVGSLFKYSLLNPDEPQLIKVFPMSLYFRDFEIRDGYLYIIDLFQLKIYDISDPLVDPQLISSTPLPVTGIYFLTLWEQYAVCGGDNDHPWFIDITDPSAPEVSGQPVEGDPVWRLRDVIMDGRYMYELYDSIGLRVFKLY